MTKIYEALEKAEKERGLAGPPLDVKLESFDKPEPMNYRLALEKPLTALYQKLYLITQNKDKMILQFVGSGNGNSTSAITREFAQILAFKQKKSVLLLDAEPNHANGKQKAGYTYDTTLDDIVQNNAPLKDALHQHENSKLFFTRVTNNGALPALANDMPLFDKILKTLKSKFDIVLIASSLQPGHISMLPLSQSIDGFILIVEAEKTKWQAAKKIKDIIQAQNGNILGVILNNRKYPIPQKIYEML